LPAQLAQLPAVGRVVLAHHRDEARERDFADALEHAAALQLILRRAAQDEEVPLPRPRKIFEAALELLLVVEPLARERRAVQVFERRQLLAQNLLDASRVALALDVAQVADVLDEGEAPVVGPRPQLAGVEAVAQIADGFGRLFEEGDDVSQLHKLSALGGQLSAKGKKLTADS